MTDAVGLQGARTTLLLGGMAGWLAGCGAQPAQVANTADAGAAPVRDYRPAAGPLGGASGPGGRFALEGSALPGAAVRLSSPSGAQQFATADGAGNWRFDLAP